MVKKSIFLFVFLFLFLSSAWALEFLSPREGEKIEAGTEFIVIVKPDAGEASRGVALGFDPMEYHALTGTYRQTIQIAKERLGPGNLRAFSRDKTGKRVTLEVNYTVILPPTTTVQSIGADFNGDNETFLNIARKPNRELVVTEGTTSTDQLYVGAIYSDGVARVIDGNPDITYQSLNEKVAIVIPPSPKGYALVQATGPGKTEIVVRYKGLESRVTVHVKECPYIEGKTEKEGCPF